VRVYLGLRTFRTSWWSPFQGLPKEWSQGTIPDDYLGLVAKLAGEVLNEK
jgi:hypothetical protein